MKKVELGVFLPNANRNWILSTNVPEAMPSHEVNRQVALLAEKMGWDYALSQTTHRGFDGETKFMNYSLDTFILTAALASETKRLRFIGTAKILLFNPIVLAKMVATLDDLSEGRFALNVVTGDNREELKMMGLIDEVYDWPNKRYDYAEEWVNIVKQLWSEERVNFKGNHFKITDAYTLPKPVKQPSLICAGTSDKGMSFTAKNCNEAFITGRTFEEIKERSLKVKKMGKKLGRTIKTQTPINIIQGNSDAEAQELVRHIEAGRDDSAISNIISTYSRESKAGTGAMLTEQFKMSVFYGNLPLIGSPETIANTIEDLVINGELDGILLCFPDFIEGMNEFNEKVVPILAKKGLREAITMANN